MKLILTDYIASLKEEKELDSLIEELLREYNFEIVFSPKKGERQYGVDIYAVGEDWTDGIKKVFLVTVKQGNLDRKNWQGSIQAIQPSLQEICTVFVRNNIAPEHTGLPIKIIVAHNGVNEAAIQQNWCSFADTYPAYKFVIWQLETIVAMVQEKLINENVFSDKAKRSLRKIIICLDDHNYDFAEFVFLIDEIIGQINLSSNKRSNLNLLRKINLLNTIIVSYCEQENDLRLALKASEITILKLWQFVNQNYANLDVDYLNEFIRILIFRKDITLKYFEKFAPLSEIKDGLSKHAHDPVAYCFIAYEHVGFMALAGLDFIQLSELVSSWNDDTKEVLTNYGLACANVIIAFFNNNKILYNPLADDQIIEICLCFLLLYKVGRIQEIKDLLILFHNEITYGKKYKNIAPHFHNNIEEVYELDKLTSKRGDFDYQSSCLLTILTEWGLVAGDEELYNNYVQLKNEHFTNVDLILWFPDEKTEELLYKEKAYRNSGYSLSGIKLDKSFSDCKTHIIRDHQNNQIEAGYYFFQQRLWVIGLIACRHFRTYIFPHYWRQLIIKETV